MEWHSVRLALGEMTGGVVDRLRSQSTGRASCGATSVRADGCQGSGVYDRVNLVGLGATLKIPPPARLQGGEVKAALSWAARRFDQGASVCRTDARMATLLLSSSTGRSRPDR